MTNTPSGEEKICELLLVDVNVDTLESEFEDKPGYKHQKLIYPDRVRANKTFYIIL